MAVSMNSFTPINRSAQFSMKASVPQKKHEHVDDKNSKPTKHKDKYNDPLLTWPYRGLAFTNDVGAAVMDIAPGLGTALWVPALMYFGADIYDKYKTNEKEYDPSGKRGFKQAVFQACASVIMPIVVVHNGQKVASMLGEKGKDGMSLQMKEEIDDFTVQLLKRRKLKDYEKDTEGFKKEFNEHLITHLQDKENSMKTKNPLKLLKRWIFGAHHTEKLTEKKIAKIKGYAGKNIDEMFEIRKDLLQDKRPNNLSDKLYKKFNETKQAFAKDKHTIEGHVEDAIKETLKQRQRDRLFHTKLWKTAGGFIALGSTIKFIDSFVEKYVIEKVVEPGLQQTDKFESFGRKHT